MTAKANTCKRYKTSIYWFTHDLRIDDNLALLRASQQSEKLLCIYIIDPQQFLPNRYHQKTVGEHRWRFLNESLQDLHHSLCSRGQRLLLFYDKPIDVISRLLEAYPISAVFGSCPVGWYERKQWEVLGELYASVALNRYSTYTLLDHKDLPFSFDLFPCSFSQFRKRVEPITNSVSSKVSASVTTVLPPSVQSIHQPAIELPAITPLASEQKRQFPGGALAAKRHLRGYFSTEYPSLYKQVRNSLDGWNHSTKFSPWLALGCLSVKQILSALAEYEQRTRRNESTEWIRFELLWREYFQWLAYSAKERLFSFSGIQQKKPLTSFYPARFQSWSQGNTPEPLVNALMNELNVTGYMSNRGRQIVASYFVNDLNMDWRYGAAYFEQQLVDYDMASNWGNWQYLAGVGTDPHGKRYFDIAKQRAIYDPEDQFIHRWNGFVERLSVDTVDEVDWPVS